MSDGKSGKLEGKYMYQMPHPIHEAGAFTRTEAMRMGRWRHEALRAFLLHRLELRRSLSIDLRCPFVKKLVHISRAYSRTSQQTTHQS